MAFEKAFWFIKRGYLLQMSYKFDFFLRMFFMLFNILTYYFIAKMMGDAAAKYLEPYGGDYFSFVLIGMAFSGYLMISLRSFSESVRDEQMMGTMEAMLVTPTNTSSIIALSSLWSFIFASIRVLLYLVIGIFLGVNMTHANVFGALVILILTIICFSSIGILSASFIMVFKRGDPINMLLMSSSELFGGVLFPIEVFPDWLQSISHILPITYAVNGMRHALLQGYTLTSLAPDILTLLLFTIILLPLSLFIFEKSVLKVKAEGGLVQY
ncbi:MAG TPA: ABC transporter permease [Methanothrix sp.]|nr:ABC transporter permease [Methanothrix sp.]HPT37986.1 ABC transporter permease [Methanothrix sp.]